MSLVRIIPGLKTTRLATTPSLPSLSISARRWMTHCSKHLFKSAATTATKIANVGTMASVLAARVALSENKPIAALLVE